MSDLSNTASIESLLQHGDYLRALARKLVLDDERAEDLVQQVWLTVLERRALPKGSPRAWLHVVLRNLAFRSRSRELERPERERQAARAELQELDGDADLDARQLVIEVLRGLRQPYRQTLYLRYVRDLSPAEIAAREDVPIATVKTHLQRGLAMMREELDRRSRGDWRAWCVPVLGLAGLGESGALGLLRWRLGSSTALRVGLTVSLATAAALVASLGVWALRAPAPGVDPSSAALGPERALRSSPPATPGAVAPVVEAPRVALAAPDTRAPGLSGRVVHADGAPVEGARVRLAPRTATLVTQRVSGIASGGGAGRLQRDLRVRWSAEERVALTDEDGHFELRGVDLEDRRLTVAAQGAARLERMLPAELALPHDLGDLLLEPPVIVAGRVVDAAGEPVAGARFWAPTVEHIGDQRFELHSDGGELLGTSAEDGSFWIEDLPAGAWSFSVESDDRALLRVQGDTARGGREVQGLRLTCPESATIRGRLRGVPDELERLPRVVATAQRQTQPALAGEVVHQDTSSRSVEVDSEGRFELRGLWRGASYTLQAQLGTRRDDRLACSATVRADAGADGVELAFEETTSLALELVEARGGAPVEGARVAVLIDGGGYSGLSMARSDARGRCRLATGGAPRGRLFVEHERHAPIDRAEFELTLGAALEIALEPAAVLSVLVVDLAERPVVGRLVVATAAEGGGSRRARTNGDGAVVFGALAPGMYGIATPEPERERESDAVEQPLLVPLEPSSADRTVRLRAGEREEVRLQVEPLGGAADDPGPTATLGGLLRNDAGAPLSGARVRVLRTAVLEALELRPPGPWSWERDLARLGDERAVRTDADGRFVLPAVEAGAELLLTLDAAGYARRTVPVPALSVGEARLDLEVHTAPGGELRVVVDGADARVLFARLRAKDPERYALPLSAGVDATGEARFLDLPAGRWRAELFELVDDRRDAPPPLVWSGELELGAGEPSELRVDLR